MICIPRLEFGGKLDPKKPTLRWNHFYARSSDFSDRYIHLAISCIKLHIISPIWGTMIAVLWKK